MARPSGELGNQSKDSEQSDVQMDLETSFTRMRSLKREYCEGHVDRVIRLYDTCQTYRFAKFGADSHRFMADAGGTTTIDLDSATNDYILHIEAMMGHESTARDACYKAIEVSFGRCLATFTPAQIAMRLSVNSTSEDLIVEPIEEAVALYDDMLKELSKSMENRRNEPGRSQGLEFTMFTIDNGLQNILQGPEYRYFASLANRPAPDSIQAFNQIISKITQQSVNTINAMLPHIIYKITNAPETPVANSDKMIDAGPAELFEAIVPHLKLGNDIHMTFKRVGKTTLDNLQRLKEQNESWLKIWEEGLMRYELKTVKLSFDQVKNAMMNLERTMTGCLRTIHTHQMKKGW